MRRIVAIFSLAAVALVLVCTHQEISEPTDSIGYISAAISMVSGRGFVNYDGRPLTTFPPLYPVLLAIPFSLGLNIVQAARYLNALALGMTVFTAGRLLVRHVRSAPVIFTGLAAILFSIPLLHNSLCVMPDGLLVLCSVFFVSSLSVFMNERGASSCIIVCAVAALGCLLKYVALSMALIGSCVIIIAMRDLSWGRRLACAALFCALSLAPVGAWCVRNYSVIGSATRVAWGSQTIRQGSWCALETVSGWVVTHRSPFPVRMAGLGALVVTAGAFFPWRVLGRRNDRTAAMAWSAGVFVVIYPSFLILSMLPGATDDRLMAPIYVVCVVLLCMSADNMLRIFRRFVARRVAAGVALVLCSFGVALIFLRAASYVWINASLPFHQGPFDADVPLRGVPDYIARVRAEGGGETYDWEASSLMAWLRSNRPSGPVYSNLPYALYFFAGTPAKMSPSRRMTPAKLQSLRNKGTGSRLVWLRHHYEEKDRESLYTAQELSGLLPLKEMAVFPEGTIYRIY